MILLIRIAMSERTRRPKPVMTRRIANGRPLLGAAAIEERQRLWESTMNTPEFYTAVTACVSCLTILVLMAVGAW